MSEVEMEKQSTMATTGFSIPAAQYLRMSTEHQQYSLDNQRAAIEAYASSSGFAIVRTYSDSGKSGLGLKDRDGLRQLLNDVVAGSVDYRAVLVYDVSRWGRFQDADEAAHYEFLCKSAGVRVWYCAESFSNDNSFSSSIMKALKRIMAGEFSRELSGKVSDGSKRVSERGFRVGGAPGYGLRRMLVSADGAPKCLLSTREKKSLQSDRVILIPGPDNEVRCVREIFRMFTQDGKWPADIARELRRHDIAYNGILRKEWYPGAINRLLKNPKYCGCSVFGQSTRRLHKRRIVNPRRLWSITKDAWQPIVDQNTFDEAQRLFERQTIYKTDTELLAGLKTLLKIHGELSGKLVDESVDLSSAEPYVRRFGSLSEAFERVGYLGSKLAATRTNRRRRAIRDQVIAQIVATDPNRIRVVQPDGHWRPKLRAGKKLISVYVCGCLHDADGDPRWVLNAVSRERNYIALIVRLNPGNESVMDIFVVPDTRSRTRFTLKRDDPWLACGTKLDSMAGFLQAVKYN
jgi:DNA invertase Pin-like site-specific DNA recombinase